MEQLSSAYAPNMQAIDQNLQTQRTNQGSSENGKAKVKTCTIFTRLVFFSFRVIVSVHGWWTKPRRRNKNQTYQWRKDMRAGGSRVGKKLKEEKREKIIAQRDRTDWWLYCSVRNKNEATFTFSPLIACLNVNRLFGTLVQWPLQLQIYTDFLVFRVWRQGFF